jgi:HEAT repeat protein
LHLLALRDSDDTVRAQAVESLDVVKDDELQASLIKELAESNSPYRLQAIDALRIFRTRTAIDALGAIVQRNASGQDVDARLRAIDVLGRMETTEAAHALLEVSIADSDVEDRARAAQALGSMTSDVTLRFVLDRLRELNLRARAWQVSWSWRSAWLTFVNGLLAMAALSANLLIHGFALMTVRRWRRGLVLSTLGIAALVSALVFEIEAAIFLFVATLFVGLLMSFRLLVLERESGAPLSRYRRCLSVLVCASCLGTFLYFHGLPCLLTKRFRRGLLLMAFEAVGILLLIGTAYVNAEFAAFNNLSIVFSFFSNSFLIVAGVLLVVTFLSGIGTVWVEAFAFQDRRRSLRRIAAVHAALAANRQLPALLLEDCVSGESQRARWSRRILWEFGRQMGASLRDRFVGADAPTRREIFSILARRHDSASLEFLQSVAPSFGWRARVRYVWARLTFAMALWPTPLLLAVGIALYVQIAVLAMLYARIVTDPARLEATVMNATKPPADRKDALNMLQELAAQNRSVVVGDIAKTRLTNVITSPEFERQDDDLQLAALRAMATVGRVEERRPLVDAVARLLAKPTLRAGAVATLRAVGSGDAIRQLTAFIEQPLPPRVAEDELKVRREAIGALAEIRGIDAFDALMALDKSKTLNTGLTSRVKEVLASFDPLVQAEFNIANSRYVDAIALATRMLDSARSTPESVDRARDLLSRAYIGQTSTALSEGRYDDAKGFLAAALDSRIASSDPALVSVGLNLAFVYHEERAPKDARAYNDVYDVLMGLQPLNVDPAARRAIQANLAEASLTTGRYEDAERLGRELLNDSDLDSETSLTAKFIVYASRVLSGQDSSAGRQDVLADYQKKPRGFRNHWSYTGTRVYIQRAELAASEKAELLADLDQIEKPK